MTTLLVWIIAILCIVPICYAVFALLSVAWAVFIICAKLLIGATVLVISAIANWLTNPYAKIDRYNDKELPRMWTDATPSIAINVTNNMKGQRK